MKFDEFQSDDHVRGELGRRIASARLALNLSQSEFADAAGVSKSTVERIEKGESAQMTSFVRILRALGLSGRLDLLVPEPVPGPIELLEHMGRRRRRAGRKRTGGPASSGWTWGDEE